MSVVVVSTPRSLFIFAGRRCPTPSGEAGEETSTFGLVAGAWSRLGRRRPRAATPEPGPALLLLLGLGLRFFLFCHSLIHCSSFCGYRVVVPEQRRVLAVQAGFLFCLLQVFVRRVFQACLSLGFCEILVRGMFQPVWKSNSRCASPPLLNHDLTPSTRRHLDGVAVWVLHDSIQSSGPRRRREMT